MSQGSEAGTAGRAAGVKRIAIVGPTGRSMTGLRGALIRALIGERHRVLAVTREATAVQAAALTAAGAEPRSWSYKPSWLGLLSERNEVAALRDLLIDFEPHVVLAYGPGTMEPAVEAAKAAGVKRIVCLVNGLPDGGLGLQGRGGRRWKRVFASAHAVVFHNRDDQRLCEDLGLLPATLARQVVAGAGVDLQRFAQTALPPLGTGLVFAMIAALDQQRGVTDYCAAAREVKARAPGARFLLAGPALDGEAAAELAEHAEAVEYLGALEDVRDTIAGAHVIVYPSHGEGMPRCVLEAMAMGRPVITTDAPGCRDTVDDRVSGCLVPPGDSAALAAAMESFLKRPDLIPAAARASRSKAERRFDEREVNRLLVRALTGA